MSRQWDNTSDFDFISSSSITTRFMPVCSVAELFNLFLSPLSRSPHIPISSRSIIQYLFWDSIYLQWFYCWCYFALYMLIDSLTLFNFISCLMLSLFIRSLNVYSAKGLNKRISAVLILCFCWDVRSQLSNHTEE